MPVLAEQRVLDAVVDPDPLVHPRGRIRGGVLTFAAHRAVLRAAGVQGGARLRRRRRVMQRQEQARAKGMRRLARRLGEHGLLREDLAVGTAERSLLAPAAGTL